MKPNDTEIRVLLSILNTTSMGRMIMELLGLHAEYSCRKEANPSFGKLSNADAAFVVKSLLLKQSLVPHPQTSEEIKVLNRASVQIAESFFDHEQLKQYEEPSSSRYLKHMNAREQPK